MKTIGFRGRTGLMMAMTTAIGATGATGCGDDATGGATLEIAGAWTSAFGSETISATSWKSFDSSGALSFEQKVTRFDNAARSAILQNLPTAEYAPNTFARVVWTAPSATGFSYCQYTFGHATEGEAQAAPETDVNRADLATGCGGFAWTTLTKK